MTKRELLTLCDRLENLLNDEEEYLLLSRAEGFHPTTWSTFAQLREALTGYDCIQSDYPKGE